MNRLSLTGWIVSLVLNLLCVALLSGTHGVAWWVIRVWQSDSNAVLQCDKDVSLLLYRGACTQSNFGGASTSDCVGFGDDSAWRSFDAFLNGETSLNSQSADMAQGAKHALSASDTLSAAIAFSVVTVALHAVSLSLQCCAKTNYKPLQIVTSVAVFVSLLLEMVSMALSSSNNDIVDDDYWRLLACPKPLSPDESLANSSLSLPFVGFLFALLACVLQFASMSFLLGAGKCCFCLPCVSCCGCMAEREIDYLALPTHANDASAPLLPPPSSVPVWVESEPVKSDGVQYMHTAAT